MKIKNYFDNIINNIPMYKLVLYVLFVFVLASFPLSYFGKIAFTPLSLLISLITLTFLCVFLNFVLARFFKLPMQFESSIITAFILYLILVPAESWAMFLSLCVAAVAATLSKYFLVYRNAHIFNPAAVGLLATSLFGFGSAFWWVGSFYFFPLVLLGGLLIIEKTKRYEMFFAGLFATLISAIISAYYFQMGFPILLYSALISGPAIFFLTVMITEPHTIAPKKMQQIFYAFLIILLPTLFMISPLNFIRISPELSLLIVNFISFFLFHKQRLILKLIEIKKLNESCFEYIFDKKLNFKAGQYMEWVLENKKENDREIVKDDLRGSRRYFSLSSAPNTNLAFTTKFPEENEINKMSSFKKNLKNAKIGDTFFATQLSGDFILPENKNLNLCFVAGGIGITPFISHLRNELEIFKHPSENRNITLFYCVKSVADIAFLDIFEKAINEEKINLRVIFVVSGGHIEEKIKEIQTRNIFFEKSFLTKEILNKYLQNIQTTHFYISGPNALVQGVTETLEKSKIPNKNIHTDYFPGF